MRQANATMREESVLALALATLLRYRVRNPDEASALDELHAQLRDDPRVLRRSDMRGHVTTSALVLDPSLARALFVHHRALDRWLQPGGHYEPPGSLWDSACREALEETGVPARPVPDPVDGEPLLLDIDSHDIPPRPSRGEAAHRHHDFAFLAIATSLAAPTPQADEVLAVRWIPLAELAAFPLARTRRLARKAQALLGRPDACGLPQAGG